jgi:hydrogenase small subunit
MTNSLCPKIQYNNRTSWCVKAGGPCIGCAERNWVDKFAGFYQPLPGVKIPGLKGVEFGADTLGAVAAVATVAGVAIHAAGTKYAGRFKGHDDGGDK